MLILLEHSQRNEKKNEEKKKPIQNTTFFGGKNKLLVNHSLHATVKSLTQASKATDIYKHKCIWSTPNDLFALVLFVSLLHFVDTWA